VEKPSDRFNLIVVARHAREKNIGALISGLANCDDFHVTFVGQGPLTQDLMQAAREKLNLEQFDFVGTLSNGEILKLMQNSDGFLSASVNEGSPLTCLEAVACRLPMLLSDIPGHVLFQKFGVALTFDLNRQKDFALVLEEFRLKIRENRFEAAFDAMQEELNEDRIFSKWKHVIFNE
jgi:glycosyltransferase involved in cell wall biosynthesis